MRSGAVLYTLCVSLCAGLALGLLFHLSPLVLAALFAISGALLLWAALIRKKAVILVALALFSLMLGAWRAGAFLEQENLHAFDSYQNKTVTVSGTVANDPDVRATQVRANLNVTAIDGTAVQGRVQAVFPPSATLAYGQGAEARGTLEAPQNFVGDNGNEFDYQDYLRVQGVSTLLSNAKIISSSPAPLSLLGVLYALKHQFNISLEKLFPQPDASLLEGILLGERRGIPQDLTQAFVVAGLIHIVILSGYSMSVVAEGVLRSLKFLPKRAGFAAAFVALILFVALTGAAVTTVRACAMALVALVARYFGRQAVALRSLAVVAAAMALLNPLILLYDVAFIVSVLSTFGLIAFGPWVERHIPRAVASKELRSILASTAAVQILALPALVYFTGTVSIFSLPANVLVLPLLPLIMLGGFLSGLLGLASAALALAPALMTDALLRYVLLVVEKTASLPLSHASITQFPLWLTALLYVPLVAIAVRLVQKNKNAKEKSVRLPA